MLQVVLALLATLLLVLACAYAGRKVLRGVQPGGEMIRVLATRSLGSRERLVLVEIAGEVTLLGVTQQSITALRELDVTLDESPVRDVSFLTTIQSVLRRAP